MRRQLGFAVVAAGAAVVAVAGAIANSAASQEVAGVRFVWDVNITTVALAAAAVIGWWITLKRQGDKVAEHARTIADLETALAQKVETNALKTLQDNIEKLILRAVKVEHEYTVLKEEIYKEYMNRDSVIEIKNEIRDDVHGTEKRVMIAIKDLSDRFDRFAQGKGRTS